MGDGNPWSLNLTQEIPRPLPAPPTSPRNPGSLSDRQLLGHFTAPDPGPVTSPLATSKAGT